MTTTSPARAAAADRPVRRSCRRCGWSGHYKSAAMADHRKRIHSCEKHLTARGKRLRREFRESMVDRTPKPCHHKRTVHEHGTYACYVGDECRCLPCAESNRIYEANRLRQQAYGRWNGLIDATPARDHVHALMDGGMGIKRIALASGISTGTLSKLLYGRAPTGDRARQPSRRVKPSVAAALLAVTLELAPGARVEGESTRRRLRALVACGWSQSKLARQLNLAPANFGKIIHSDHAHVTVGTANDVHALYKRLVDQAPPEDNHRDRIAASRARRVAREYGWQPPLRIAGRAFLGQPYTTEERAS